MSPHMTPATAERPRCPSGSTVSEGSQTHRAAADAGDAEFVQDQDREAGDRSRTNGKEALAGVARARSIPRLKSGNDCDEAKEATEESKYQLMHLEARDDASDVLPDFESAGTSSSCGSTLSQSSNRTVRSDALADEDHKFDGPRGDRANSNTDDNNNTDGENEKHANLSCGNWQMNDTDDLAGFETTREGKIQQEVSELGQGDPEEKSTECHKACVAGFLAEGSCGRVSLALWKDSTLSLQACRNFPGLLPEEDTSNISFPDEIELERPSHVDKDTPFALKIIKVDDTARLTSTEQVLLEIEILERIKDRTPFLVQHLLAEAQEGHMLIGMELCTGGDLFTLLGYESLTSHDVLFYATEIALGLHFLHSMGVIHGDLKPENVALGSNGHVRLIDFGLSVIVDPERDVNPRTGKVEVVTSSGTLPYCSPEVLARSKHGYESDWWSFGVVVYEMHFGTLPWFGNDDQETCQSICSSPLEPPEGAPCDPHCLDLIYKLLQKDANDRLGVRNGLLDVKRHKFFSKIDWDRASHQRYRPPFILFELDDGMSAEASWTGKAGVAQLRKRLHCTPRRGTMQVLLLRRAPSGLARTPLAVLLVLGAMMLAVRCAAGADRRLPSSLGLESAGEETCDFPRIDARSMTPETFYEMFVAKNRPVVLLNAMEGWPALAEWRWDNLRVAFDKIPLRVGPGPYPRTRMSIDEYLRSAEAILASDSNKEVPGVFQYGQVPTSWSLWAHKDVCIPHISFFHPNSEALHDNFTLACEILSHVQVPHFLVGGVERKSPTIVTHSGVLMGYTRSGIDFHRHQAAINLIFEGRKLWYMKVPNEVVESYAESEITELVEEPLPPLYCDRFPQDKVCAFHEKQNTVIARIRHENGTFEEPDLKTAEERTKHFVGAFAEEIRTWQITEGLQENHKALHCVQHPGEIVFIPQQMQHAVLNLEPTVAMQMQWDKENFGEKTPTL
ncbi:Ribosomal protein S6 kinase alpha-3 (S6K-alpha-3) (90 kDa ribosomal protein S6 kinase 3) (p90-RSK 3) (p90RSK3) (Insulin-stimulated protein kinase 1) (ISPK-1) (MAP kinase-activated protein kinase 1b) (MAPK-activated protein kinase 1b) (MAPKAP kinase 1b) (MAPKAPK-1b) (Ribosomal S6 kinase 2) (RSK-2) (pp90RSK2) [Durusdinium trenchii]|uniref:Uncharacterized protein n=1 Tax=Durusdinium trenchii TaxID=1381693 RepID=A0ABP0RW70_9DINO